jgi:hypothetical protein
MVSRETAASTALDFLQAVAKVAETRLGKRPERIQRSEWMVHTSPTSMSSKVFERWVFDRSAVSTMYQTMLMGGDFPTREAIDRGTS